MDKYIVQAVLIVIILCLAVNAVSTSLELSIARRDNEKILRECALLKNGGAK